MPFIDCVSSCCRFVQTFQCQRMSAVHNNVTRPITLTEKSIPRKFKVDAVESLSPPQSEPQRG